MQIQKTKLYLIAIIILLASFTAFSQDTNYDYLILDRNNSATGYVGFDAGRYRNSAGNWTYSELYGNIGVFEGTFANRTLNLDAGKVILSRGNLGIGLENPTEKLQVDGGSLYFNGEGEGVIVDAGGNKRVGFMKYSGREAGIWRTANQDFEFGRVSSTNNVKLSSGATVDLYLAGNGNVGVGTTGPTQKFDVNGHAKIRSNLYMDDGDIRDIRALHFKDWDDNTGGNDNKYRLLARDGAWMYYDGGVVIGAYGNGTWSDVPTGRLVVQNDMVIGDATPIAGTALTVDGRVYISDDVTSAEEGFGSGYTTNDKYKGFLLWVEEGIVSTDFAVAPLNDWPDYVFGEDYDLPSLTEVEAHIKKNGHLHTIPGADEVREDGFAVKDMTKRMVQTIEELTLHTINQEKQINKLIARLEALEIQNK
ncbi:MAG: hypothetical protein ACI8Q1_001654 [Parvicella sp.]|jgi:hypothetical protein